MPPTAISVSKLIEKMEDLEQKGAFKSEQPKTQFNLDVEPFPLHLYTQTLEEIENGRQNFMKLLFFGALLSFRINNARDFFNKPVEEWGFKPRGFSFLFSKETNK